MAAVVGSKKRPKNLDLMTIRLPLPALVSILHRLSGAVLFLIGIPLLLAALQGTLASQQEFDRWHGVFGHWFVKLILIGLLWAYLHHFCAGLRFLALDLHKGTALETARATSKAVLIVSILLTVALGVWLW
jgi:succinate dehydrogenase / fumarate reductase, cytochrome b subunit